MLVRSTEGYECGGYTSVPWRGNGFYQRDQHAFLFSLTNSFQKYSPKNPDGAVLHSSERGPCFSLALGIGWDKEILNEDLNGSSLTCTADAGEYQIKEDGDGRNLLTGSNSQDDFGNKLFTVQELEVWLVKAPLK